MQLAFLVILIGALCLGLAALAPLGWVQYRRRRLLGRLAARLGLRFSADDPFELVRRYGAFVLATAGHSPRSENVIYGRYGSWQVRVFDYCFEVGHGPVRVVRHYSVLAAETDLALPAALLWHTDDAANAPLSVPGTSGREGPWLVCQGAEVAGRLSAAFAEFAAVSADIQTEAGAVLVASPVRWPAKQYGPWLDKFVLALDHLRQDS